MSDVFISKSTKDDVLALSLYDVLEKAGIDCWISNRDLTTPPPAPFSKDIAKAILSSRVLLLVLSRNSVHSQHVKNEVGTACDNGIPVIAYEIDELKPSLELTELTYYINNAERQVNHDVRKTGNFKDIANTLLQFLQIDELLTNDPNFFVDNDFIKQENFENLIETTKEKRQAFTMSIDEGKPYEYDDKHLYRKIIRLDVVDSIKNTWRSYRFLTIKNISKDGEWTNHIVHKECGECKVNFKEMKIRAQIAGIDGERLNVESLTTIQPNCIQVFRINFKSPLPPGEEMTIFYRIDWPNEPSAYYMQELNQSISLKRYKKGVEDLTFGVFEPYQFISSSMNEVDHLNARHNSSYQPQFLTIQQEELLAPLKNKKLFGVRYHVSKPTSILYQIQYKLLLSADNNEDNDDF